MGDKQKQSKIHPQGGLERKRQLGDVMITEGSIEDMDCEEFKRKRSRENA